MRVYKLKAYDGPTSIYVGTHETYKSVEDKIDEIKSDRPDTELSFSITEKAITKPDYVHLAEKSIQHRNDL